jgi:hypothetical protein
MKTITITINGNGKPEVEASGFIGGSCKAATKPILDALGASNDNADTLDKPELHQVDTNPNQINLFG